MATFITFQEGRPTGNYEGHPSIFETSVRKLIVYERPDRS